MGDRQPGEQAGPSARHLAESEMTDSPDLGVRDIDDTAAESCLSPLVAGLPF